MNRGALAIQHAFDHLGRALEARSQGRQVAAPDWIDPHAVEALTLVLPGEPAKWANPWCIQVALRDGVGAQSLPKSLTLGAGHPPVPLRFGRAPRARAQSLPPSIERTQTPLERGTVTALVRDRLAPDRCYLITCGHVVAPDQRACFGEDLRITAFGSEFGGLLCEWLPALPAPHAESSLDAALIELDSATVLALRQADPDLRWLPSGISDEVKRDMAVSLRRTDGPLNGALKVRWSGRVQVGDDGEHTDYVLCDALGYSTALATMAGDSGAPLWTADDALLGMHIAAISPDEAFGANAVMGRITPVLDWFCVKPFTRQDPATVTEQELSRRLAVPDEDMAPLSERADLPTLAKTLWGEARGEGVEGMQAVACVVMNRFRTGYRGQRSVAAVCLDPKQFSCWNASDPNRAALDRIDSRFDAQYSQALSVASQALRGQLADVTRGARHYVASTLRQRPPWLVGKTPCVVVGGHEFYNDVA